MYQKKLANHCAYFTPLALNKEKDYMACKLGKYMELSRKNGHVFIFHNKNRYTNNTWEIYRVMKKASGCIFIFQNNNNKNRYTYNILSKHIR